MSLRRFLCCCVPRSTTEDARVVSAELDAYAARMPMMSSFVKVDIASLSRQRVNELLLLATDGSRALRSRISLFRSFEKEHDAAGDSESSGSED
jgi:hypothetical protein